MRMGLGIWGWREMRMGDLHGRSLWDGGGQMMYGYWRTAQELVYTEHLAGQTETGVFRWDLTGVGWKRRIGMRITACIA